MTYDVKTVLDLYYRVYNRFVADKELDERDISTLGATRIDISAMLCAQSNQNKRGAHPCQAFTTTVLATRSPKRCFSSEDQMRIAPSRYGTKYGISSRNRRIVRTAACE